MPRAVRPFPHQGHDGNQDGYLTYSDALERSCNVYFQTVADRLGTEALSAWFEKFGIGRKTGIGIEELRGRLPRNARHMSPLMAKWFAGIVVITTTLTRTHSVPTIVRGPSVSPATK